MTTAAPPTDPIMQAFDALRDYEEAFNESYDNLVAGDLVVASRQSNDAEYNVKRAQILATLAVAHELRQIRRMLNLVPSHD